MDVAQTNWMQHMVTTSALVAAGANGSPKAPVLRYIKRVHNRRENLTFMSREPLTDSRTLHAQIQSLAALRIVQEYVASMETVGALLRGIRHRADGGVLRQVNVCQPRDVRKFFQAIRAERRRRVARLLNWPDLGAVARAGSPDLTARARKLYPWLQSLIPKVASQYVSGRAFRLVNLSRMPRDGRDPRESTYVFVYVLDRGERRPTRDSSTMVQALNKLGSSGNRVGKFMSPRAG